MSLPSLCHETVGARCPQGKEIHARSISFQYIIPFDTCDNFSDSQDLDPIAPPLFLVKQTNTNLKRCARLCLLPNVSLQIAILHHILTILRASALRLNSCTVMHALRFIPPSGICQLKQHNITADVVQRTLLHVAFLPSQLRRRLVS